MLLACRNFSSFFSFSLGSLVLFSFLSFSVEEGREGTKKRSSGPRHLNLDNRKRDKRWKEGDPTSNNTERKEKKKKSIDWTGDDPVSHQSYRQKVSDYCHANPGVQTRTERITSACVRSGADHSLDVGASTIRPEP